MPEASLLQVLSIYEDQIGSRPASNERRSHLDPDEMGETVCAFLKAKFPDHSANLLSRGSNSEDSIPGCEGSTAWTA